MNNRLQHSEKSSQDLKATTDSRQNFASAEELLKADRAQTSVPPAVGERIADTIARDPNPPPAARRSWWQRLFGN
jgi:hypothetical protein